MPKKIFTYLLPIIAIVSYTSLFYVSAGTTAPVTTAVLNPENPNGNNGWYTTPVNITLNATDLESGIAEIHYRLNLGTWRVSYFDDTLNLISNPSFETTNLLSNINTDKWSANEISEFVTYIRDVSTYAPGYQNVSIKIDSTDSNWHSINNVDNFASASSYSNMNSSAWIKTEGVVGSAGYTIYAISKDILGQNVYTLVSQSTFLSGTNDWTPLSTSYITNVDDVIGVYMDIGIQGTGTIWVDAVNINESIINTFTNTSVGADGQHTFYYYSVDQAGNQEITKEINLKIDQTPPGNWRNSGAYRAPQSAEHHVYVYSEVDDLISGLSTSTNKFQYNVESVTGFGYYNDLLRCNSTWMSGEWTGLEQSVGTPGLTTAYLMTPKTDFCNSNWKVCKTVKFYAEDLAGNSSSKDLCINGPWIKVRGNGIVFSNNGIDMISESNESNTDGLIEVSNGQVDFFTTENKWKVTFSPGPSFHSYSSLWEMSPGKTQITGNLSNISGVYFIDGNYTLTKQKLPGGFSSSPFTQVIFVNGNLTIDNDIDIANDSALMFVVNGDINIQKGVLIIKAGMFAEGTIFTAYDIKEKDNNKTLTLHGVYSANKIALQRTVQGANTNDVPSEIFNYEPKYVLKISEYLGTSAVRWLRNE